MEYFISKVRHGYNLTRKEAFDAMLEILVKASDEHIYKFLTSMNKKVVTSEELIGFVTAMKSKAITINPNVKTLVDTCGTGGDNLGTINVSTGASVIASAAGVNIAKHGNYSVSSKSGSANIMEEWGYDINLAPEKVSKMIEDIGYGFMFAPLFHPAMKRVKDIRSDIAEKETVKRTIFNMLGPLSNPANANAQLIGIYDYGLADNFCAALKGLGVKRAYIVYGSGLDEISNIGDTMIHELKDGKQELWATSPECYGFDKYGLEDIIGGSPKQNAQELINIFRGKEGARRDILVLNAGAAIYLGGKALTFHDGIQIAKETVKSGAAEKKRIEIVEYSRAA